MTTALVLTGLSGLGVFLLILWVKRLRAEAYQVERRTQAEINDVFLEEPETFLSKGYVFCTLFSIRDIENCASDMGLCLTHLEQVQVVSVIKQEFNPHRGISYTTIREAIVKIQTQHINENTSEDYEC